MPAQEKFLQEYAEKKGFKVARVFAISESASGKKQREVFGKMMAYVTKQNIKIVICEKVDRLTRNFKDAVSIDEWLEKDEERQVHLVKDSLILHKNSRSQEKLNWGIRILFAKNYIDNLSEEVKKGLSEKLRQGWLPTKPPPGYKTIGEKGHKIHVIDESTAPLVIKMFELYATSNYSQKKLTQIMYESGLRNSNGNKVLKSRIAELLSDPFYISKVRYRNTIHSGAHPSLIPDGLFLKVQQVLKQKTTPKYRKHFPVFKALIRCAECEGSVTWEIQKNHWYGHCNKYRDCSQRQFIRQEYVEEQLLPHFEKVAVKSHRLAEWIKTALKESHQDEIAYNSSARSELNKRYATTQRRLEMIYDDKLDGKIEEDFYQQKFEQFTKEKESIEQSLKKHSEASNKYYELGSSIIDISQRAKEIYLNKNRATEERRLLLGLMFQSITLNAGKIEALYSPAFQVLAKFVPEWNKKFEPTKNPSKNGVNGMVSYKQPVARPPEVKNNFRTSKNTDTMARFDVSELKSRHLLRGQDSNLEPSRYA